MENRFNEVPSRVTISNIGKVVKSIPLFGDNMAVKLTPGDVLILKAENSTQTIHYESLACVGLLVESEALDGSGVDEEGNTICPRVVIAQTIDRGDGSMNLKLSCPAKDAEIYYTTDDGIADNKITTSGTKYTAGTILEIVNDCTFRAVAKSGSYDKESKVATKEIDYTELKVAKVSLPEAKADLLGKSLSDLQENVKINAGDVVSGTLKYVGEFDAFAKGEKGNFLALYFEDAKAGQDIKFQLVGNGTVMTEPRLVDKKDGQIIVKVANTDQVLVITQSGKETRTLKFTGLKLEKE